MGWHIQERGATCPGWGCGTDRARQVYLAATFVTPILFMGRQRLGGSGAG